MEINEVKIQRILNPTSIDLGEYVINPFMGCEFSCLYCYVRSNRVVSRKNKPWGTYVDIRINAPERLEKELVAKKPKQVLLGSTTECFQPLEKKYRITRKLLEVLTKHKVGYVILTRSPAILDCLDLLRQGHCKKVYFTVNDFAPDFKAALEPKSPAFRDREEAIQILLNEGIPAVPYISPMLPWITAQTDWFARFEKAASVEFECLNFNLPAISTIINVISRIEPELGEKYRCMAQDKTFYTQVWQDHKNAIEKQANLKGKRYNIFIHEFGGYFKNTYDTKEQA